MDAIRFEVHGRVQGVGFRWWSRMLADDLQLVGWVRNRSDGTVEVVAAGTRSALDALRTELRNGPPGASVSRVDERATEIPEQLNFQIVH